MKQIDAEEYSPENVFLKLKVFFLPGNIQKDAKRIFVTSLVTAFLCYFWLMVTGYAGPDAVVEGINLYQGFGWAISMGRWALAYMQRYLFGNAIIPFLIVILYALFIAGALVMIIRMTDIRNRFCQVILSVLFISFPVVQGQFEFLYMAVYYAMSFFCATLGLFFVRAKRIWGYPITVVSFVLMLGMYQAYVSSVAALAVILLMFNLIDGKKKLESFSELFTAIVCGLIASVIDVIVVRLTNMAEGQSEMDKIQNFSFADIVNNLGFSFEYSVKWFGEFFEDTIFSRNILYAVILAMTLMGLIISVIRLMRERKRVEAILLILFTLLFPHATNSILYLFPHNGITEIMKYQYALIFILLAGLIERCIFPIPKAVMKWASYVVLIALAGTYVVSDNIAGVLFKVIYTENHTEASMMLNRVYALDGYVKGETKVVLADAINWMSTYNEFELLRTKTHIGQGPIFWSGDLGMDSCRRNYFLNYLGIETGRINPDEYSMIMESEEYQNMPIWPAEGSVAMIDGYAVIKNEWN